MAEIKLSKNELNKKTKEELKSLVEKDCWIVLKQYFDGIGNGPAAKIAVVALGTLAKEAQAKNNARQLDILEQRLLKK